MLTSFFIVSADVSVTDVAMQVCHSGRVGRHPAAGFEPPSGKQTRLNRHKDSKLGEEEKQKIEPSCATHEIYMTKCCVQGFGGLGGLVDRVRFTFVSFSCAEHTLALCLNIMGSY